MDPLEFVFFINNLGDLNLDSVVNVIDIIILSNIIIGIDTQENSFYDLNQDSFINIFLT